MTIRTPTPATLTQLALDLDLPEQDEPTPDAALRLETARRAFDDREQKPEWYGQFDDLLNAGWPFRVACYIAWASVPREKRSPKTLHGLATEVLGLTSARPIFTWRNKNPAIDDTIAIMQAAPLFEHRREIYDALIDSAKTADYKNHNDRKLALELLGDYVPRKDVTSDGQRIGLTADDLASAEALTTEYELQFEWTPEDDADDAPPIETAE